MLDKAVQGDFRERVDGTFEGWCWSPERPDARLVVDLLVNDTLATSIVAAVFRRDLQARGIGDGRHGFKLRLPPNLAETNGEHIVTARERASGVAFGRVLRQAGGAMPGGQRLDDVTETLNGVWQRLDALRALNREQPAAGRLREALGVLAGRLAARHTMRLPSRETTRGVTPPDLPIRLPDLSAPALSVVLLAGDADATRRQLAALAPAADLAGAEFIVVDPGADPAASLLPARMRNLRYVRDLSVGSIAAAANLAVGIARGSRLLLIGEASSEPSAAGLLELARIVARLAPAVLLGPLPCAALVRLGDREPPVAVRLNSRLGMVACIERALWPDLGPFDLALHDGAALECADLALRARLLGLDVSAVAEPEAAEPSVAAAIATDRRRAQALFTERWGPALPA
jgi:hypothetical protein